MAADVLTRIHALERFGSVMGLDRLRELMRRLGDPQEGLKYIHIAGTNGKGSVCKFLEKGLMGCGYHVGMYISPFIEVFNERIQCDSVYIRDEELDRLGGTVLDEIDRMVGEGLTSPTEFEAVMAIAFLYFAEKKPDIVLLETGLGGIGDATNIIRDPLACVITSVSYDHMDVLGDNLEEIGENKAGIIKKGAAVISNVKDRGPAAVIARKAYEEGCRFYDVSSIKTASFDESPLGQTVSMELWGTDYSEIRIPMVGRHQADNLKTALAVIEILRKNRDIRVERSSLYQGLSKAVNPGRFEVIDPGSPMVIIDGAHNEAGAESLEKTAKSLFEGRKILLVAGILRDKEVDRIIDHLLEITDDFVATAPNNPRKLEAEELADKLKKAGAAMVETASDPEESIAKAMDPGRDHDVIIFAGSLYLIGDIRRLYRNVQRES